MGSPLSPLLAEIFMDHLEKIIHKHKISNSFIYWYRYVDDVLACFTGTNRQLDSFLEYINSLHEKINFTIETEKDNSINFLDLKISRIENKHIFSIYRKPSHTDTTIHQNSAHPVQHKLAAFHSMIHRLLNIPLSEKEYHSELNVIKQIAVNNGYSSHIINSILNKKITKNAISEVYPNQKINYNKTKTITYFRKPSEKIKTYLNKRSIDVAYKTNNSLGKWLKDTETKINKNKKSGVYKLSRGTCSKIYIGRTGRTFRTRISEHKNSFLKNKTDSTYAEHLIKENHSFNDSFDILHVEQKSLKLNLLETLEINKQKNSVNLLNDQTDVNNSPLLNIFIDQN